MKLKSIHTQVLRLIKSHPKISIPSAAFLVVLVIYMSFSGSQEDVNSYHTVQSGNFLVSIVEGGNLEAVSEVVVRNQVDGDSRIIYIIPEGSYVKEGDKIVELDSAEAEEALKDQQITFENSRAAYVTAENDLEITKSTVDSDVTKAELDLTLAQMALDKFEQLDREQQKESAQLNIATAKLDYDLALQELEISKRLEKEGFETKSTVDGHGSSVQRAFRTAQTAEADLRMLEEFDLEMERETLKSAVEEAQRAVTRAKKQGDSLIAQAVADKNSAEATLTLNEEKMKKMKDQLSLAIIYAPQDGLIVYAVGNSRYSSESMIEEGAQVRKRQELIKIPDTSQMKVELKVHESHIGQVQVGQPAFVVLDSLPDEQFRGEVTKVAILPDAQSRWGNANLKVYSTEIVITDPLPDVKPGVSARAEIVVANLQDVLTVPIQSVTTVKGQQVCYVKGFRGPSPVPVEIGMFNSSHIEIKSGLDAGDQVMLAPPVAEEVDLGGGVLEETEGLDLPTKPAADSQSQRGGGSAGGEGRGGGGAGEGREGGGEGRGGGGREGGGGNEDRRAQMIKRFDTDGDGKLSEEERKAMMESFGGGGGRPGGGGGRPSQG